MTFARHVLKSHFQARHQSPIGHDRPIATSSLTIDEKARHRSLRPAPQASLTWLPNRDFELSLFAVAGFNLKNAQTQYASGNYVDIDYALGYRAIPTLQALEFSLVGYWFEQLTDDELNGNRYLGGHRSKGFAVGPQVRYQFAKGGFALKWLHETSAENRPKGNRPIPVCGSILKITNRIPSKSQTMVPICLLTASKSTVKRTQRRHN